MKLHRRFLATLQQPGKGLPDTVQIAVSPPTGTAKAEFGRVTLPEISIEEWKAVIFAYKATPTSSKINKIFTSSGPVPKVFPFEFISSKIIQQQKFSKSTAFLFRKSYNDLLERIRGMDGSPIVLCGQPGIGKSTAMFQIVNHLNQSGWITLYMPNVSGWTSGIYPYESTKSMLFQQPELAFQVLKDFVALNRLELSKIKNPKGKGSFVDLMLSGSNDIKNAQQLLADSIDLLFKSSDRPNILLAVDQVNALYSKTAYCDAKSNPLTADKFQISRTFYQIFNNHLPPRVAVCLAMDNSVTQIRSYYLEKLISEAKVVHSDPLQLPLQRYESLNSATEFHAIVHEKLDPSIRDLFPRDLKEAMIPKLQVFNLPVYDVAEAKTVLQFYKLSNCLHGSLD